MSSERWREVSRLYNLAMAQPAEARGAFLADACTDDAVREEVEALLAQPVSAPGFLEPAAFDAAAQALRNGSHQTATSPETSHGPGFEPGSLVDNRYRIVSLLGRGAMGEVYRADDLQVGQRVALKFLSTHFAANSTGQSRFTNEVRLARRVSHPNVCRVHDIGQADGRKFLSMEYIDGETLASLLHRIGRLSHDKVFEIARQLCAGLAAAHDQGVLHRDLKPGNIMIDGRGRARITDFGLAVTAQSSTAGEIAGTPAYMAPEQLAGAPVSAQTDLFALGLILTELLTGRPVLRVATVRERMQIARDASGFATAALEHVTDARLRNVIALCLQRDAAARPPSARSVAMALPGGGDPLAAAVAAGETPSPDMVAAAETQGIRPATAWIALALSVAGLFVAVFELRPMMLYRNVSLTKPPDALVERAQQVIARMGYTNTPADRAYWFVTSQSYRELSTQRSGRHEPFARVSSPSEPRDLLFVYRQSPQIFVPENIFGVVQYREPPADLPGMADVATDSVGQLRRFTGIPNSSQQQRLAVEPNWSLAFADAGLDLATFTRVDTSTVLPVVHDSTAAWEGVDLDKPSKRLRVTAASFKGIPVFFDVGSTASPASESSRGWWIEPVPQLSLVAMGVAVLVGAVVLARRNIRQGQWDRSGASKVGAFFFGVAILSGVLRADHVPVATTEIMLLMKIVAWNLSLAGFMFLMYVAFEPSVRRRWPHMLTAWARVLTGRVRDPLVGRDILIGALAGIAIALLREAEFLIAGWLHLSLPPPFVSSLDGLGSWRQFTSLGLIIPLRALYMASAWLLVLLLLRMLLRRNALAVIAAIAVAAPTAMLSSESLLLSIGLGALVSTLSVVVLMQFGLLALVVAITVANAITHLPMTLDSSQWYAGRSWIVMICLLGLIVHGFGSQWLDPRRSTPPVTG